MPSQAAEGIVGKGTRADAGSSAKGVVYGWLDSRPLVCAAMIFTGAAEKITAKMLYNTELSEDRSSILEDGYIWLVYMLSLGNFVACTVGPALSKRNRLILHNHSSWDFWRRAGLPALIDVGATAMTVASLEFVTSAAVAGILKTALQLLLVALGCRVLLVP